MSETAATQLPTTGNPEHARGISLGAVGGWLAVGAVGTAAVLEGLVPPVKWRYGQTAIVPGVDGVWPKDYQGSRLAVYAGMGRKSAHLPDADGVSITAELAKVYSESPIDSCNYNNWGIGAGSLAAAQKRYYETFYPQAGQEGSPGQLVAGHSMGLLTFFRGVERLRQQGVPVPRIDHCMTFSSPGSIEDTFQRDLAVMLSMFPTMGGLVTNTLVELVAKLGSRDPVQQSRRSCVREAFKASFGGISPMLKLSMARLLVKARNGFESGVFSGVIGPWTQFDSYISNNDNVVKVWPAVLSNHKNLVEPYGATMYVHHVENAGHANIVNLHEHMQQADCGCRQEPFIGVLPAEVLKELEMVVA